MNRRIASIDIFRALTMLIMLFVNDFAGMTGLPHWLHHAAADEDMMGFSDLVFPAFLFCAGLSIPYAVGNRFNKGASQLQVIGHILIRSLALIVMGLFAMNFSACGVLPRPVFILLSVAGFFLIWNTYPRGSDGRRPWWVAVLQALGIILLIGLVIYKDLHGMPFRHGWWGILGLIGWAYMPCAVGYVVLRGDFTKVSLLMLLVVILCVLNAVPFIPEDFSSRAVMLGFWPGGWTHPMLCALGMYTSLLLIAFKEKPGLLMRILLLYAAALLVLAFISHTTWIVSKIQATPTWAFFSAAASVAVFALLYWLADLKGLTKWARPISPAGTATLTCYTIPYIWYAVQQLVGAHWPAVLTDGVPGLLKALAFSFIIIGLTWLFGKAHLKLKL